MSRRQYRWGVVGWLLLATSLASAQTVKDPTVTVKEIVSGLGGPTAMAFIGPNDILVLQKHDGTVRRVLNGVLLPGAVLDVAVDQASERGLLGIALHPTFPVAPWVYLYYTESGAAGDTSGSPPPVANRIYRFSWNGQTLVDPALILNLPALPGPNHNGGALTFGPDGKLYTVIGDLNHNGQLQNVPGGPPADDTSVIIRLNDDGTVPSDNPFFTQG
jgi:glucose/arabinose dehydrogenase